MKTKVEPATTSKAVLKVFSEGCTLYYSIIAITFENILCSFLM